MRVSGSRTANHAAAYHNLGNTLGLLDQPFDALACLRRAAALQPDDPGILVGLALALKPLGMVDEAAAVCRRALRLRPDDAHAHNTLGNVLLTQGLLDEAIASYREALRLQPDAHDAHSNLLIALNYLPRAEPAWLLQQHRDWARSDVRKALPGCAAELGHPIRRHRSLRIERAELDRNRIPIHESGRNAWALHVLRGRGKNASGEREARNSES